MDKYFWVFGAIFWGVLPDDAFSYQLKDGPLFSKRPPWLTPCRKSDPDLNNCLNTMFKDLFPELTRGIPEINVDPFEPLALDSVTVSKGTGPIVLAGGLYNLTVIGAGKSSPSYTEFDEEKKTWNFGIIAPSLDIQSEYNLKGKILVLPLVGHGNCDLKLFDIHTEVKTNVSFPLVENRKTMQIDSIQLKFKVGGMKVKFSNLFNGNKILGQTVNQFINKNALEIIGELDESIGQSLAKIFKEILNNVYIKIPLDMYLLTDEQYQKYVTSNNS